MLIVEKTLNEFFLMLNVCKQNVEKKILDIKFIFVVCMERVEGQLISNLYLNRKAYVG